MVSDDHPLARAGEGRLLAALFAPDGSVPLQDDEDDAFFAALAGDDFDAALQAEASRLPSIDLGAELRASARQFSAPAEEQVEDDYSDEEWLIVRRMRELCGDAIKRSTSAKRRKEAVEWLFVRGTAERRLGIEFHLACQMLEARPWVIHALVHHIWWSRGIQPGPLPFLADPLPEALASEAIMTAWEAGPPILETLWRWPGAPLHALRELVPELREADYQRSLDALLEAGLIADKDGTGYVSARSAKARRRMSWSRTFVGE